ncbi:tRNA pseudouridine synthase D [Tricholoma matsutake]|nr:tRNA pseudouridine synthase D [Tricholoma matsutake 945]
MTFLESDVGISEYIGRGIPKIEGIIKQRFTDFLVYEIDLDGNTLHLKSLEKPVSSKNEIEPKADSSTSKAAGDLMEGIEDSTSMETTEISEVQDNSNMYTSGAQGSTAEEGTSQEPAPQPSHSEPWPEHFTTALAFFLSNEAIEQVMQLYLEGPDPPRVSDSGWGGRVARATVQEDTNNINPEPTLEEPEKTKDGKRGRDRAGRNSRGERGSRGGRGGRAGGDRDHRKVLSDPITSKTTRTALHQAVRRLFGGKLDTETETSTTSSEEGSRIVIKWARRGGGRGGRGGGASERGGAAGRGERIPRGTYPPYIHFTLQKTNRDTQDALGHLARTLHVHIKDLSVAGTKDKRGVTVQRVSLKRNGKTVEDIWKSANGRRNPKEAVTQRGERGVRIADFNYRKASLELGMLKGNAFIITLRSVKVDSMETLNTALNVVKYKGFINYYGMQRFGTASVPTHSIGLALLKSEWQKAISLILRKRHGEHPDVVASRDAWLVDGDLDRALNLMPKRVIAERCILESFKKQGGDTRNAMGALSTIPRNLRLMYIHAYQSYVWNAIVSERIRKYGADKPVVGDLVFETNDDQSMTGQPLNSEEPLEDNAEDDQAGSSAIDPSSSHKKSRKPWFPPRIKTLTEDDLDKYTIFDVIMPLPGTDVAYPGGPLGERYREYLRMDGLDPDNWVRKQKDYTLNGSYRAILHLPKELSWSVLRYTDPDVALAQADEDKLLNFDPPAIVDDGKFMALQINITLGTASYATMALREITKTETSSHFQTNLTNAAEDQKYRGVDTGHATVDNETM